MSKIRKISHAIKKFNVKMETVENLRKHRTEFIDINRHQMRHGENGLGDMRIYRSASYAMQKRSRGTYLAPFPRIDLFDTGSFQNKMVLRVAGTSFKYSSTDSKRDEIVEREGEQIFELNKSHIEMARALNQSLLKEKFQKTFK
jgi:hypothetical protein